MKRLEIWSADLSRIDGSHVQQGFRPILIISNDLANTYSPVITAIPLTSRLTKCPMPTHIQPQGHGLTKTSLALCEQVLSLDKVRLKKKMGAIESASDHAAICHALAVQLDMAT